MALKNSQYDAFMRHYQQLQFRNKHNLDERTKIAYHKIPRLAEIDREIASSSLKKARLLLGESSEKDFNLKKHIQSLSSERTQLLLTHGFSADYLKPQYTCPICRDTGYVGNEKCACFRKAIIDLLYTQSNIKELVQNTSFDKFSLQYYADTNKEGSPRRLAEIALAKAKTFVEKFDTSFENLFIFGNTGLGKTFLSHCITRELLDTTHSVIYYSAFDLFHELADITFSNNDEPYKRDDYIFDCDLLIIDDLGTELTNNFVTSQFFQCINERFLRKKSTIISTNLDLKTFKERYSERVFSRIYSNYTMIKLIGEDIRIQKKLTGGI